jgi:alpha-L-arabinofuranosidase
MTVTVGILALASMTLAPMALASMTLAPAPSLVVDLERPTVEVSPHLYGIFFEEINWAGDGGLYAELVRNRSFEDSGTPEHWRAERARMTVEGVGGKRHLVASGTGRERGRIVNGGYAGMGLRRGIDYRLEIVARSPGSKSATAYLADSGGRPISARWTIPTKPDWSESRVVLRSSATVPDGQLVLEFPGDAVLHLDWVSMFPGDSRGVFRKDLFEALRQLRPAFLRFPGGCWVEGETMETAYRWKSTVGPLRDRKTVYNLWRYQSTNGLGYHEYLQLARDLNAVPMFVANCGMSHREVVPMDAMGEYVQDVLDAIEYANGPITSKWGAMRARHGSVQPFGLKYLEIGNENGGPAYEERYGLIYRAVKERYPDIVTIANVWGGSPQKSPVEVLDEHYYADPGFFIDQADRYDRYDRKGPKIYVGEYAVTMGVGEGNLRGALAEAAFMIGMERNSDVVAMSSYAPLLSHPVGKAWNPDLIYFDSLRVVPTPSYHVQAMFARHRPDWVLGSKLSNRPERQAPFPAGGVGVGTWRTGAEFRDIRVVQDGRELFGSRDGEGMRSEAGNWDRSSGTLRQRGDAQGARMHVGTPEWHSYRVELKARKLEGAEGFLITVGMRDEQNFIWLNLGGWNNTQHAIERAVDGGKSRIGQAKPGRLETGRWYDVAVDYSPERVRAWLDGELLFDEGVPVRPMLHAIAGRSGAETIVKIVNVDAKPHDVQLELHGKSASHFTAAGEVLEAEDDTYANTFDQPGLVRPRPIPGRRIGRTSTYTAPPHSFTVLRIQASP